MSAPLDGLSNGQDETVDAGENEVAVRMEEAGRPTRRNALTAIMGVLV